MPDAALFDAGARICRALGIDQDQAARLSDDDRRAVLELVVEAVEAHARQRSHGRTGAAMAHGTPWQRRQRDAAIVATVRQISERNPKWSGRQVQKHVAKLHKTSDRSVRRSIERSKKGGTRGLPPASTT